MSSSERMVARRAGAVLGLAAAMTVLSSRQGDWEQVDLFTLLLVFGLLSDAFPLSFKRLRIAGSFVAIALAMALLGPAPAVVIAVVTNLADTARHRPKLKSALVNLATYATFPLVGGLIVSHAGGPGLADTSPFLYAAVVFSVFLLSNLLNFVMVAGDMQLQRRLLSDLGRLFVPVLPVQIASGLLVATVAFTHQILGFGVVALLAVVGLVFQILLTTTFQSFQRGEQLERRTRELASLQVGLLSTVLQTLSLRDKMTARHSAAVARYARAVADTIGLDADEADVIHTAGLLHDIGKFIFPDSILFANRKLSDADFEIVKQHPEQGARLVRRLEGYGPVADIILAHHERIDGRGYPNGISGTEIPVGARIISIADTYDVMTARDSYRTPVSQAEAFAELRRVAGAQLDAQLVEVFIDLVSHEGIAFHHMDDRDFERELDFEARVIRHALPRVAEDERLAS